MTKLPLESKFRNKVELRVIVDLGMISLSIAEGVRPASLKKCLKAAKAMKLEFVLQAGQQDVRNATFVLHEEEK